MRKGGNGRREAPVRTHAPALAPSFYRGLFKPFTKKNKAHVSSTLETESIVHTRESCKKAVSAVLEMWDTLELK